MTSYYIAKLVIKLINSVADVVNKDASIEGLLKVVFIEDYNVSLAEIIVPASDISQVSMARDVRIVLVVLNPHGLPISTSPRRAPKRAARPT